MIIDFFNASKLLFSSSNTKIHFLSKSAQSFFSWYEVLHFAAYIFDRKNWVDMSLGQKRSTHPVVSISHSNQAKKCLSLTELRYIESGHAEILAIYTYIFFFNSFTFIIETDGRINISCSDGLTKCINQSRPFDSAPSATPLTAQFQSISHKSRLVSPITRGQFT